VFLEHKATVGENAGMADVVADFLAAAHRFRDVVADDEPAAPPAAARTIRNAVARVYLAATMLPPAGGASAGAGAAGALDDALAARLRARLGTDDVAAPLARMDEELAASVSWLEDDAPQALPRAWLAFERGWGSCALDVLEPLHRIARHGVG
jgi:hypothetical protein